MSYKEKTQNQNQAIDKLVLSLNLFKAQGFLTNETYDILISLVKEVKDNKINTNDAILTLLETFRKTQIMSNVSANFEDAYVGQYLYGPYTYDFIVKVKNINQR